jgi:hypothetical protein
LVYRKWLEQMIIPIDVCFLIFNMVLIIHSVLAQRQRSIQYQLRSSVNENTCGSRLSRCFLLVTSSIVRLFTAIQWCIRCGNIGDNTKAVTAVDDGILDQHQESLSSADIATNTGDDLVVIANTLPSMQVCNAHIVQEYYIAG